MESCADSVSSIPQEPACTRRDGYKDRKALKGGRDVNMHLSAPSGACVGCTGILGLLTFLKLLLLPWKPALAQRQRPPQLPSVSPHSFNICLSSTDSIPDTWEDATDIATDNMSSYPNPICQKGGGERHVAVIKRQHGEVSQEERCGMLGAHLPMS